MTRWPPLLWLPVYVASELILLGSHRRWSLLAVGGALMLIAFAMSLWLSLGKGPLAAGVIPVTAVSLTLATVRSKTVSTPWGLSDCSGDMADPAPGIGIESETPVGDTTEHSDTVDERHSARGEEAAQITSREVLR